MATKPIHQRRYHTFLSHASKDKKAIVDQLYQWLSDVAHIPVWYDRTALSGGSNFTKAISEGIPECRSMIVTLSPASIESGWVEKEFSLAENHSMEYRDFKVIPIMIADCEVPELLSDKTYIDARETQLTSKFYESLLRALYPFDPSVEFRSTRDIFVSRTWRPSEAAFADGVCREFISAGFRLIGDAQDHPSFTDQNERVDNIISSCGGLLAILPCRKDRPNDAYTSKYCLQEIEMARAKGLPCIVIAEPGVEISPEARKSCTYFQQAEELSKTAIAATALPAIERMEERWKEPNSEHYAFYATSFARPELNNMARQLIQQITGMSCMVGEDIHSHSSVQEKITELIRKASLVVADVSDNNLNTLIEAGIARGADVEYRMIAKHPRKSPPFLFRDRQIEHYKDDGELLGSIHRLAYPFRRRVLNYEI